MIEEQLKNEWLIYDIKEFLLKGIATDRMGHFQRTLKAEKEQFTISQIENIAYYDISYDSFIIYHLSLTTSQGMMYFIIEDVGSNDEAMRLEDCEETIVEREAIIHWVMDTMSQSIIWSKRLLMNYVPIVLEQLRREVEG